MMENMTIEPQDAPPFQFSLRGLFWLTTVVAMCCASLVCMPAAFAFWPLMAAIIACGIPGIPHSSRVLIFLAVGALVVLLFWWQHWPTDGSNVFGAPLFIVFVATFVVLTFLWIPQALVVDGIATYFRERRRKRQL
jgi:hypothetical protein